MMDFTDSSSHASVHCAEEEFGSGRIREHSHRPSMRLKKDATKPTDGFPCRDEAEAYHSQHSDHPLSVPTVPAHVSAEHR